MTQLRERELIGLAPPPLHVNHRFEWLLGILGITVGGVGSYLYFGNPLNTIQILGWEPQVGTVAAWWGYALQIAGALLLFGCFSIFARKVLNRDGYWSLAIWTGTFLATAALLYALTFAVLWIRWAA